MKISGYWALSSSDRRSPGKSLPIPHPVTAANFPLLNYLFVVKANSVATAFAIMLRSTVSRCKSVRVTQRPFSGINLSRKGALRDYAPWLWPEAVVLNEVYPEPGREELRLTGEVGSQCWHIVGVQGMAWPPFPRAYRGGIPCCASWLPTDDCKGELEVIIGRKV